jgi:Fe-S oxidoreductase
LRDEIHGLFPERKQTHQIMQNTFLLSEFLVEKAKYHPPRMNREAVMHGHCHHKAIIKGAEHEEKLLEQMQMKVQVLNDGCCGMAGSFGFESEHYDVSAKIGERALLPHVRRSGTNELIIADGFSCREQISQMTERHGLHIAEVLQLAIQHGAAGPNDLRPEQALVEEHRRAIRKSKMQAAAIVGGAVALAVTGVLAALRLNKMRMRKIKGIV